MAVARQSNELKNDEIKNFQNDSQDENIARLFHRKIYNAAKAQDEKAIYALLPHVSINITYAQEFLTPAGKLAAEGEINSVNFLQIRFNVSLENIAYGYAFGGHVEEANKLLTASKNSKEHTRLSFQLACGYARRGDVEKVNQIIENFLNPNDRLRLQLNLINQYALIGNVAEANKLLKKIKNSTYSLGWLVNLAHYYACGGHVLAAFDVLQKMQTPSDKDEVLNLIAGGFAEAGNVKKVQHSFKKARNTQRQKFLEQVVYSYAIGGYIEKAKNIYKKEENSNHRAALLEMIAHGSAFAGLFSEACKVLEEAQTPAIREKLLDHIEHGYKKGGHLEEAKKLKKLRNLPKEQSFISRQLNSALKSTPTYCKSLVNNSPLISASSLIGAAINSGDFWSSTIHASVIAINAELYADQSCFAPDNKRLFIRLLTAGITLGYLLLGSSWATSLTDIAIGLPIVVLANQLIDFAVKLASSKNIKPAETNINQNEEKNDPTINFKQHKSRNLTFDEWSMILKDFNQANDASSEEKLSQIILRESVIKEKRHHLILRLSDLSINETVRYSSLPELFDAKDENSLKTKAKYLLKLEQECREIEHKISEIIIKREEKENDRIKEHKKNELHIDKINTHLERTIQIRERIVERNLKKIEEQKKVSAQKAMVQNSKINQDSKHKDVPTVKANADTVAILSRQQTLNSHTTHLQIPKSEFKKTKFLEKQNIETKNNNSLYNNNDIHSFTRSQSFFTVKDHSFKYACRWFNHSFVHLIKIYEVISKNMSDDVNYYSMLFHLSRFVVSMNNSIGHFDDAKSEIKQKEVYTLRQIMLHRGLLSLDRNTVHESAKQLIDLLKRQLPRLRKPHLTVSPLTFNQAKKLSEMQVDTSIIAQTISELTFYQTLLDNHQSGQLLDETMVQSIFYKELAKTLRSLFTNLNSNSNLNDTHSAIAIILFIIGELSETSITVKGERQALILQDSQLENFYALLTLCREFRNKVAHELNITLTPYILKSAGLFAKCEGVTEQNKSNNLPTL